MKLNNGQTRKMNAINSFSFYTDKIYGNKKCYKHRKRFRPTRLGNIYVLEKRKRNAENEKIFQRKKAHL